MPLWTGLATPLLARLCRRNLKTLPLKGRRGWRERLRHALARLPRFLAVRPRRRRRCGPLIPALSFAEVARHPVSGFVEAAEFDLRASTIPRLHTANTAAWGLLKWGRWVVTTSVH